MAHETQPELDMKVIATIIKDVEALDPLDDIEYAHKQDALKWLSSGVNPFRLRKPDVPPKHLVSYFVLVDQEHKSILLVDHIKAQLWLPTGGHVRINEPPSDAVVREAQEELHVKAVYLRNIATPLFITVTETVGLTPGHVDVSLWYTLRGSVHDRLRYDRNEFTDIEWYTFDEIMETDPLIFDPHLKRFVSKLALFLNERSYQ